MYCTYMNNPQKYNELNLQKAIDSDLGYSIYEGKKNSRFSK